MTSWIDRLFNKHKMVRRLIIFWVCWIITVTVLRVTEAEVITKISAAGATVVTAVIGLLATVIAFYQWSRNKDDADPDDS
jgi:small neutral amino acid transporter SnatA (MarC family)